MTNTGGVLSHAAVVAREFGLPAVVGIAEATDQIADGREVEIDGTRGIVRHAVTGRADRPAERTLSTLMLGVASGAILVPLNSTMLAVALPGIMDEFGLGANAGRRRVVTLYLGAVAVALPVSGSLGDRYGHR